MRLELNKRAVGILRRVLRDPAAYGVSVTEYGGGVTVVDAGVKALGGLRVGLEVVKVCMGGLGDAYLTSTDVGGYAFPLVNVVTDHPAVASLAAQAAYPVEGVDLIVSGPGRALLRAPRDVYDYLGLEGEDVGEAVFVIQSGSLPSRDVVGRLKEVVGRDVHLYLVVTPLRSVAGVTQVAGRVVESVIVRLRLLGYDVRRVIHAYGTCPVPPVGEGGRAPLPDDMINYLGVAHLWVRDGSEELPRVLKDVVVTSTPTYGECFYDLLEAAGWDFRRVKGFPNTFSIARVVVNDLASGEVFDVGRLHLGVVRRCFPRYVKL
ncbi:MAG: hypothetical protein B6U73_04770 [Desulfurococcales archaeon ex4484_204]|nr:MAG: hypothetical protein B6U73_04770 [Desulfurococcales archaeon ex4484_204]